MNFKNIITIHFNNSGSEQNHASYGNERNSPSRRCWCRLTNEITFLQHYFQTSVFPASLWERSDYLHFQKTLNKTKQNQTDVKWLYALSNIQGWIKPEAGSVLALPHLGAVVCVSANGMAYRFLLGWVLFLWFEMVTLETEPFSSLCTHDILFPWILAMPESLLKNSPFKQPHLGERLQVISSRPVSYEHFQREVQ